MTVERSPGHMRYRRFRRGMPVHLVLIVVCLAIATPFAWLIATSLKPIPEFYRPKSDFLPQHPTLAHYRFAFGHFPMLWNFYRNSVVVTAATVVATTGIAALAGYGFARFRSRVSDIMFWTMVATLFFPIQITSLFVLYELTNSLGLFDTRIGLILPYTSLYLPMYIFIMRTVFAGIPRELDEAARIDGASAWKVFHRVMLPLAKPGLIIVAMLVFTHIWGEYLWARTLASDNALTLGVGMTVIQTNMGGTELPVMAAAYTIAILPPLVLFIILQRWFLGGLTHGAIKG